MVLLSVEMLDFKRYNALSYIKGSIKMKPASIDVLFNAYQDTDEYKELPRPEALQNMEEILFDEDAPTPIKEQDISTYGVLAER